MQRDELRRRTKQFALRVVKLFASLVKRDDVQQVIGRQLLRSGTSVGAQYREACRARSPAEFISKVTSAMQELDETLYWMELLVEGGIIPKKRLGNLMQEADELLAIFFASVRTAGNKKRTSDSSLINAK